MKLSYFMPTGCPWVDIPGGGGHGNPTRHKSVNKLIGEIVQHEVRGEGSEPRDVRDMTIPEFLKELEILRDMEDGFCRYRNPLMGIYQFHFITRLDDVCNFKMEAPKGNPMFDFALSQAVSWSKNVRDSRNCPDQLLLASTDHNTCIFLALVLWLEHFLEREPQAKYMMTAEVPAGRDKKSHKKFIHTIAKTYRNRLKPIYEDPDFKQIYNGTDQRPLGSHSKRKMGSSEAKRRGAHSDQVEHRGRWVCKSASRIVTGVYINPEDVYADAICASKLARGGPIKYKLKDNLPEISTAWLREHVIPNIARRYSDDEALIRNLGLALLWAVFDEEAKEALKLPPRIVRRVELAYQSLAAAGRATTKPRQPVLRVPLHVYRNEEETIIEEIIQEGQGGANRGANRGNNDRPPAALGLGGNASQHQLQTIIVQQRSMQRSLQDLESRVNNQHQSNREYMETKFRTINNNIRTYGGTIHGAMARGRPAVHGTTARRNRQRNGQVVWPTLAPNIKDLVALWQEYDRGLNGRLAAKEWTREERGGGGNRRTKQTYYRRNVIWQVQALLVRKGNSIYEANRLIKQTYGAETSITNLSKAIVRDRRTYPDHDGLHPNLR